MEYRKLPRGDGQISIIGMGTSCVGEHSVDNVAETVNYALEHGVNYYDMAGGHASIFRGMGEALSGRRREAMLQVHFGADYSRGEYAWNPELDSIKRNFDRMMGEMDTDYVDFGFMHCLDEEADLEQCLHGGTLDFIRDMQRQGVVKHIGLSTHTPSIANRVLDMKLIDMLMFSINPMYDFGEGEFAFGAGNERLALYRRCESEGVGITVMKPFNGGLLLDAARSPFHKALTTAQCIQYALDKPGVLSVLQGAANITELAHNLEYLECNAKERDYSLIGDFAPEECRGMCVYCRHCHPCPEGLDIALINKYYDLARLGDLPAYEHYRSLRKTAERCEQCGHCSQRCPFGVDQSRRMVEIAEFFGQ